MTALLLILTTQQALIDAIKSHPSNPQSAEGQMTLGAEAKQHSLLQAKKQLQGHHNWDSRFQALIKEYRTASEVCAESWPGETLEEAAVEIVHSWFRSPGHWRDVMEYHDHFGYDMKRGDNGIWYGTGIFAED